MLSVGSGVPAPWLSNKILRAKTLIKRWLQKCNYLAECSISGGKDSLVVAHLVTQLDPTIRLVWVNQGPLAEWADCLELIEWMRSISWNVVELCPPRSLLNLYQDLGLPLEGRMTTALDKKINQRLMYEPLAEYRELNGLRGYAWGIRGAESRGRAKYLQAYGDLYQRKDGLWICTPVGWWSTIEIWQYIDAHRLPYPAIYDRDRLTVRNGPPIGTTGVNWGRIAELRRYHPELYQEFAKHFPQIRNYA